MIVTLSTIPPRFGTIEATLQSILDQRAKVDEIRLYIPKRYRRFPDWDGTLPGVPLGVSIHRTDEDFGPSTKVLPAVQEFAGEDVELLFCDDDRLYPPDWVEIFTHLRVKHPRAVLCRLGWQVEQEAETQGVNRRSPRAVRRWRITDWRFQLHFLWLQAKSGRGWRDVRAPGRLVFKRSGYIDIFEGCGGVVVRPDDFDPLVFDIPPVLWTVDDVWLSGMVAKSDVPIWLEANMPDPIEIEGSEIDALVHSVIDGADRKTANRFGVEYFQKHHGIWL